MNNMINKALISRCCWQALVLSLLVLAIFPETFSSSSLFGQTWLWLMATPLSMLIVIHRHRFAAAWSTVLVNSPSRRRRQTAHLQARRKGFGRAGLRQSPQRAA
jgi:hypothetical protein